VLVAFHDPLLVLASVLVVFLFVLGARAAGALGVPDAGIRRGLHVAVGIWTAALATRFHHLAWALVPPIGFLVMNASGKTKRLAPALDRAGDPGSSRGLWTYPLGVGVTYALFWNDPGRMPILAGCLALALADPAAAWIGSRFGQRRLRPLRLKRTLEGSLAFFLVAAVVIGWVTAGSIAGVAGVPVARLAIGGAAVGAVAEALSPPGWDNAAIPILVGLAVHCLA
jgi:dolichol kinase